MKILKKALLNRGRLKVLWSVTQGTSNYHCHHHHYHLHCHHYYSLHMRLSGCLDNFVQVISTIMFLSSRCNITIYHPSLLIGSYNGEIPPEKGPVQVAGSYSLNSPVQDILDERPELLKGFREEMDKEDIWGNGWKRWVGYWHFHYFTKINGGLSLCTCSSVL